MFEQIPQNIDPDESPKSFEPRESVLERFSDNWKKFQLSEEKAIRSHIDGIQNPEEKEAAIDHRGAYRLCDYIWNKLEK